MGTLTFVELQDEVRAGLGGRADLNSRLPRIVNLGQQRLARIHDFDDLRVISTTTVANTGSNNDRFITLPTIREVYSIVLLDGAQSKKLFYRTPQFMDRREPMPEYWSRDRSCEYTRWGNTIELWPLPNATYTLRMRWTKWPTDLTGSVVSEFLQKDDVLIELSLVYALNSLGKEEDALKHEKRAMQLMAETISTDRTDPDLNITPDPYSHQVDESPQGEYWRNPFVRSV